MEFVSEYFEWILVFIVVGVFAFQAARLLKKAKKIDSEGILTDAVVTRVAELWDPDTASSSYTTYVEYREENGEVRESPLSLTQDVKYEAGDRVRIRYIPGEHTLVRPAE